MATFNKFNQFVEDLAKKVHNLNSDTLKVALSNTAPVAANAVFADITEISEPDGDVLARYTLRRDEFAASVQLVCDLIETHSGPTAFATPLPAAGGPRSGIGVVEGWRGTIVHRVEINAAARFTRSKIVDPSWFNWPALPVAMADTIVADFPLVNKSFNLSYAGNDL